jgi:hypothetical protein
MEDNRELLENLRALAADGPQDAPDRVERLLRAEFRKRSRRGRVRVLASFSGVAAMAAGIALLLWLREAPKPAAIAMNGAAPAASAMLAAGPAAVEEEDAADASFYPLPEAEALPAVENAMVVRVQLPVASLRLMGFPVDEESADAAVQAELLLGQDGLARGVRLAQ